MKNFTGLKNDKITITRSRSFGTIYYAIKWGSRPEETDVNLTEADALSCAKARQKQYAEKGITTTIGKIRDKLKVRKPSKIHDTKIS